MNENEKYLKGRGAQINTHNKFDKLELVHEHLEAIDVAPDEGNPQTKYYLQTCKTIVNKITSPDVGRGYSLNPYQGCEHGCIYCYARNSHEYWGFSAGLDFESKIIIKQNAPELLEKFLHKKNYEPETIMLSGNTDCYQPIERKMKLTRQILEIMLKYKHPVGIITKNYTVLRDIDILQELAANNLVMVMVSITSLSPHTHAKMEPRTASPFKRLKVVRELTNAGIPVGIMNAPIVPGLNDHEIPKILEAASRNGAVTAGYTMVRLNGAIGDIFIDWVHKAFPLKADRILSNIKTVHGGQLNDSRFGKRMRGDGNLAQMVSDMFKISKKKFFKNKKLLPLNTELFTLRNKGQMDLFG